MKKLITSFIILGVLLISSPAQALTINDLQKEVSALRQEISNLKLQLSGQVLGITSTTFSMGMRDSRIIPFQQKLIEQKFLTEGNATGVFGPLTYNAIKNFQTAKGLKVDGVLGIQTQSLLMEGICRIPITVLSPNGGEFYEAGSQITVKWSTCENIGPNETVRIELESWGAFPDYFFVNTLNDGNEIITLPTPNTLPGMQYGLGYRIAVTHLPKTITFGQINPRDFSDDLFAINDLCLADTWTKKADFGGVPRNSSVSFSIGSKGYVGLGYDGNTQSYFKDFWAYDTVSNTWTQKADFTPGGREEAIGFAIADKGYVGLGKNAQHSLVKDFWEYDSVLNKWTQKKDFVGSERIGGVSFSVGNKGYIGTGSGLGNFLKDFWEYDPVLDKWTQKADFGGTSRWLASGFSVGNKGYIGTGVNADDENLKDFWEYDPVLDKWTQKADFGGIERKLASSFAIGKKGYFGNGAGGNNNVYLKDFWEYDPVLDIWTEKTSTKYVDGLHASFSVGGRGYFGVEHLYSKTLEEYCPEATD